MKKTIKIEWAAQDIPLAIHLEGQAIIPAKALNNHKEIFALIKNQIWYELEQDNKASLHSVKAADIKVFIKIGEFEFTQEEDEEDEK